MALQPSRAVALRVLGARSEGLDLDAVLPAARELLRGAPLTFDAIRAALQSQFPDVNDRALGYAVRTLVPLVMVPSDDGRWGFPRVAEFALAGRVAWRAARGDADPEALGDALPRRVRPGVGEGLERWSAVGRREGRARRHARSPRGLRRRARPRAVRPARRAAAGRRRARAGAAAAGVRQPRARPRRPLARSSPTSTARSSRRRTCA